MLNFLEYTEEEVLIARSGKTLSKNTILKLDNYPKNPVGIPQSDEKQLLSQESPKKPLVKKTQRISGAPNFRNCASQVPIYGVSQPPVFAVRSCLNFFKGSRVIWINLREEPVIYINRRPFVLREFDHPYHNVNYYAGIGAQRIEEMESRMKMDIIEESKKYYGNIIIHDETFQKDVVPCWEAVTQNSVQTTREVFEEMKKDGYDVEYYRIPVTPEHVFDFTEFDALVDCLKKADTKTKIVFNCQLGRGRSTYGMVIACLMRVWSQNQVSQFLKMKEKQYLSDDGKLQFLKGEYKVVLSLVRQLKSGNEIKKLVDIAIDLCSEIVNLREVIFYLRQQAEQTSQEEIRKICCVDAFRNLERYYYLIAFNGYLAEQFTKNDKWITFSEWMKQRPELVSTIERHREQPEESLSVETSQYDYLNDIDIVYKRAGDVLGKSTILKMDHFFDTLDHFDLYVKGVPNFRKIEAEMNIYAAGSPTLKGIHRVVQKLGQQEIVWINLRAEPCCYLNGKSFVLRDISLAFQNMQLEGIETKRVELLENRLKNDILAEVETNNNRILLHDETEDNKLVAYWEALKKKNVFTPKDVFEDLQKAGANVKYFRLPISTSQYPSLKHVEMIVDILKQFPSTSTHIIFNSHSGLGRSSTAMIFAYLFKKFTSGDQSYFSSYKFDPNFTSGSIDFNIVRTLIRLIPHGLIRKQQVDKSIDICKHGLDNLDIRMKIEKYLDLSENARSPSTVRQYLKRAAKLLVQYFQLIIFAAYLGDQTPKKFQMRFSEWLSKKPELVSLIDEIEKNPADSLKIARDIETKLSLTEAEKIVYNRNFEVLSKRMILKADHFPGCQRKHLRPRIEGAPNFRKIEPNNVYGVAIPTFEGVANVLDYIKVRQEPALWCNLREEPVIYINGRPFVLRDIAKPFENIIQPGIEADSVALMELRLKKEILEEAKQNKGQILLHEENEDGSMRCVFETVTEKTVLTPAEVYQAMKEQGYQITYVRVPITDEQTPEVKDFDALVQAIKSVSNSNTHLIFNCQMGRGRTTTGTIIACLLTNWHEKSISWQALTAKMKKHVENKKQSMDNIYRDGNYKLILRLVSVLTNGKANKQRIDDVIDACAILQNLRSAIYDYKVKAETESNPKHLRESAYQTAKNYLVRYFYLIVFNEFLIEQQNATKKWQTFEEWLKERSEITNLLKAEFDLS